MFIKYLAAAYLGVLVVSPSMAQESIDEFARAHLQSARAEQEAKADADAAKSDGVAGRAKPRESLELLFIQGVDDVTIAYVRVDGRFGKSVKRGDRVRDWQVAAIGDDYVEVTRAGKTQRLLLPADMPAMDEHHGQAG